MEINLTQEELDAFTDMGVEIEMYLKNIAANHIRQSIDKELLDASSDDKKTMLTSLKEIQDGKIKI